ncbi:hypothetical protein [Fodinicurvata halophila]|uniref:hypothetical protein n=1 Tax=Fodinicurvata halophila TaxID=1419723 RepID=UPI003633C9FA
MALSFPQRQRGEGESEMKLISSILALPDPRLKGKRHSRAEKIRFRRQVALAMPDCWGYPAYTLHFDREM